MVAPNIQEPHKTFRRGATSAAKIHVRSLPKVCHEQARSLTKNATQAQQSARADWPISMRDCSKASAGRALQNSKCLRHEETDPAEQIQNHIKVGGPARPPTPLSSDTPDPRPSYTLRLDEHKTEGLVHMPNRPIRDAPELIRAAIQNSKCVWQRTSRPAQRSAFKTAAKST